MNTCYLQQRKTFLAEIGKTQPEDGSNVMPGYISDQRYSELIQEVILAKCSPRKSVSQHKILEMYDVVTINKRDRLIFPHHENEPALLYVANSEMFDILHATYASVCKGCGGIGMAKELFARYKNITLDTIMTFLRVSELCRQCGHDISLQSKESKIAPKSRNPLADVSRAHVGMIDMTPQFDRNYKFIMVYQDYLTKYIIIRPLHRNHPKEIAAILLDIFTTFGPPAILTSDSDQILTKDIISNLYLLWSELKILSGSSRRDGSLLKAKRDTKNMLLTWMQLNQTSHWSVGLPFIQSFLNQSYHLEIKTTPYRAFFGHPVKHALASLTMPKELLHTLSRGSNLIDTVSDASADVIIGNIGEGSTRNNIKHKCHEESHYCIIDICNTIKRSKNSSAGDKDKTK